MEYYPNEERRELTAERRSYLLERFSRELVERLGHVSVSAENGWVFRGTLDRNMVTASLVPFPYGTRQNELHLSTEILEDTGFSWSKPIVRRGALSFHPGSTTLDENGEKIMNEAVNWFSKCLVEGPPVIEKMKRGQRRPKAEANPEPGLVPRM